MTTAATAMFDGDNYYYLSFEGTKPCLELVSEWEDIEYRCVLCVLIYLKAHFNFSVCLSLSRHSRFCTVA